MAPFRFYYYPNCDSCRKAKKFLIENKVDFDAIHIVDTPPSKQEIKRMMEYMGEKKKLFNTSGLLYRQLQLKDSLPTMSEPEAVDLLAANGKLIKRPFLLSTSSGIVGFNPDSWQEILGNNKK